MRRACYDVVAASIPRLGGQRLGQGDGVRSARLTDSRHRIDEGRVRTLARGPREPLG